MDTQARRIPGRVEDAHRDRAEAPRWPTRRRVRRAWVGLLAALLSCSALAAQEQEQEVAPAPEEVAEARLAFAQSESAAGYDDDAAVALHDAAVAADAVEDPARREALEERIAQAARSIDPRLDDRRKMERSVAETFLPLARELAEKGFPLTACVVLESGAAFDERTVREDRARYQAQAEARDAADPETKEDKQEALAYLLARKTYTTNKKSTVHLRDDKRFNRYMKLLGDAAKRPMKLAKVYRGKGMIETAFDVSTLGASAFLEQVREDYGKLMEERDAVRAERRYERWAAPVMRDFDRRHRVFGERTEWKVTDEDVTVPPPEPGGALVVSEATVDGDYELEVDFKFENMTGTARVVVAFASEDDFCTLEFERPVGSNYFLRFCRYHDGRRSVLAESDEAPQALGGWHTLHMERVGDVSSARFGKASLSATLPITGEVAYGFFEPGRVEPEEKPEVLTMYRNLIVR